jgi:demethylmenaquinone methyltransferase/2-methoxy-6-polyprenyl-1,4-benzoquinol methylase
MATVKQDAPGKIPTGLLEKNPAAVRSMFDSITPRYDMLNALLSFGRHAAWRRAAARLAGAGPGLSALDVCAGTGALTIEFIKRGCSPVAALDFSRPMLEKFNRSLLRKKAVSRPLLVEGDALRIPFADNSFDIVSISFGLRNTADYHRAISEMARVLKPGGRLAALEFSGPGTGILAAFYNFYLNRILPAVGNIFSGTRAYSYLARSIHEFANEKEIAAEIARACRGTVEVRHFGAGAVALYVAAKGGIA